MLEIGGDIPLEQCLDEARAAGFVGMELGNKFPRTAGKLGPILEAHGHVLVSGWYSMELLVRDADAEMQAARAHIDLLKALGAKVMIVAETSNAIHGKRDTPLSARPVMKHDAWKTFSSRLTAFAERLKGEGLQAVYHHHMGTIVQSEADIDRMMGTTGDALHLLLDTGHATWGGADVREAVMWESNRNDWSFLDSVLAGIYTVPGDGHIDYARIFRELKGYSGWVVVEAEQDPKKYEPRKYAKLGYSNLSRMLHEAGMQ
jgi:inosose dehydratase